MFFFHSKKIEIILKLYNSFVYKFIMKKNKDNDVYEETLSTLKREVTHYKLANFKKEIEK